MKTIELKVALETVQTPQGEQKVLFKTVNLLEDVINSRPPQGGFSIKEIVQRTKLLGIVGDYKKHFELPEKITDEKGNERQLTVNDITNEFLEKTVKLELEDADYDKIKELVKKMDEQKEFQIISNFLVDFANQFLN